MRTDWGWNLCRGHVARSTRTMELDHGGRRNSGPRARDRSLARIGPPHKVVFNALLDLCNVQVGSEGLVRANLGPEKSRWVIRYPNGTTTDETTPYLPSWFLNGFPVWTTRITVTATAQSGPSPAPVSFSVIVRDKQAPTFLATGSVVANATSHRGRESPTPIPKHSTLRRRPRQGQPEPRNRLSDRHHPCDGDG